MTKIKLMMDTYEDYEIEWKVSEVCDSLEAYLENTKDRIAIKKVVCLGIGSFEKSGDEKRSYTHLAGLMTIVHFFSKPLCYLLYWLHPNSGLEKLNNVKCFVQDPLFTMLDIQFLERFGLQVVKDPAGQSLVDKNTLLHAICCNEKQWSSLFKGPHPAAMLTDSEERVRIAERFSSYEEMQLPIFSDDDDEEPHEYVSFYVVK